MSINFIITTGESAVHAPYLYKTIYAPQAICAEQSIYAKSVVTRAIFDVGSGGTKVVVADVDPISNKILQIHYSKEHPLTFKRDMAVSGQPRFSEAIQKEALKIFAELKQTLSIYNPTEWVGVATSAARTAENGQEFFNRVKELLEIDITVVPASEEGRLGYLTAVAASGLPREQLISFDSGGGSFQIASEINGKLEVIEGDFAYIPALETLIREIRGLPKEALLMEVDGKKLTASPNPISLAEAYHLVVSLQKRLPPVSGAFAEKLKSSNASVVGIGTETFIFAYGAQGVGKNSYSKEELWKAICENCGKLDKELTQFANPKEPVLGMILLYSIMDGLGIEKITYCPSTGSCEGIAIDEAYWTPFDKN